MKILSNKEYNDLVNKTNEEHKKAVDKLVNTYEEQLIEIKRRMTHQAEDYERQKKAFIDSNDLEVRKRTKSLEDEISNLTMQKASLQKEVDMLTKAFENLGFDVKDMKDILNKLVDGVVSKNTVNVIK